MELSRRSCLHSLMRLNSTYIRQYSMGEKRRISLYTMLTVITMICGLLSRSQIIPLPDFISTYAGDTLWALMVFWGICVLAKDQPTWQLGLVAILFSFGVELSQLYHAPWIDSLRHTKLGGLVLGFGFKWSDLACYSVGVLVGTMIDHLLIRSKP